MRRRARLALAVVVLLGTGCDAQLPDPDSAGARLYAVRCTGCHRLYAPQSMTAAMWQTTVTRMQGELVRRGLPPLTADEQTKLLDYLAAHSTGRGHP
ncbi:MAG: hypothetical protein AB7N53_13480 [Candidatus Binatia bacterium]